MNCSIRMTAPLTLSPSPHSTLTCYFPPHSTLACYLQPRSLSPLTPPSLAISTSLHPRSLSPPHYTLTRHLFTQCFTEPAPLPVLDAYTPGDFPEPTLEERQVSGGATFNPATPGPKPRDELLAICLSVSLSFFLSLSISISPSLFCFSPSLR